MLKLPVHQRCYNDWARETHFQLIRIENWWRFLNQASISQQEFLAARIEAQYPDTDPYAFMPYIFKRDYKGKVSNSILTSLLKTFRRTLECRDQVAALSILRLMYKAAVFVRITEEQD